MPQTPSPRETDRGSRGVQERKQLNSPQQTFMSTYCVPSPEGTFVYESAEDSRVFGMWLGDDGAIHHLDRGWRGDRGLMWLVEGSVEWWPAGV